MHVPKTQKTSNYKPSIFLIKYHRYSDYDLFSKRILMPFWDLSTVAASTMGSKAGLAGDSSKFNRITANAIFNSKMANFCPGIKLLCNFVDS